MKTQKLIVIAAIVCLLVGASDVMARDVSAWLVIDVDSASGEAQVTEDLCMKAVVELMEQGCRFVSTTDLETRIAGLLFIKRGGGRHAATLWCIGNIIEDGIGPGPR